MILFIRANKALFCCFVAWINYYPSMSDKMVKINIFDFKPEFDYRTDPLFSKLTNMGCVSFSEDGPWVAGGCILRWVAGEPLTGDIDLFFRDEAQYRQTCEPMVLNASRVQHTKFASSFDIMLDGEDTTIQAIRYKFFANLDEVLDSFDFTICQLGFDGSHIVHSKPALEDIQDKQIRINRVVNSSNLLLRIAKYAARGYHLHLLEATKGASRIVQNGARGLRELALSDAVVEQEIQDIVSALGSKHVKSSPPSSYSSLYDRYSDAFDEKYGLQKFLR